MMKKYVIAGLLIGMILLSGCERSAYPQLGAVTPSPTSGFSNPAGGQTMTVLLLTAGASQQVTAQPNILTLTPSTPVAGTVVANGTAVTPQTQITFTSSAPMTGVAQTPIVAAATTAVPAAGVTSQPAATTAVPPTLTVGRPATYVLQNGEFPYCIARRFNVDPDELLSLSGLNDGVIYPPGTALKLPQSGSFPGDRSLRTHPASYTVGSGDETIYGIACLFGDVDPAAIAQRNGISASATLTVGQVLNIP